MLSATCVLAHSLAAAHAFVSTLCSGRCHQGAATAAHSNQSHNCNLSTLWGFLCFLILWLLLRCSAPLVRLLFSSRSVWLQKDAVNKSALPLLRGRAHLLGEAHDLQPVALPDRSVGAGVHQLVHLLHRLDGGDLGARRHQTSSARCQERSVYWNVRKSWRFSYHAAIFGKPVAAEFYRRRHK